LSAEKCEDCRYYKCPYNERKGMRP
jgi:hypothetical protein